jgi:hypothetical protein
VALSRERLEVASGHVTVCMATEAAAGHFNRDQVIAVTVRMRVNNDPRIVGCYSEGGVHI